MWSSGNTPSTCTSACTSAQSPSFTAGPSKSTPPKSLLHSFKKVTRGPSSRSSTLPKKTMGTTDVRIDPKLNKEIWA
ncbi:hypothetical protein C8R44DRAFT_939105 [Mycena epipterygia]|nr:hypothetical protein C8R44DRAFT_939105 [Mycena epipterygia]